MKIYYYLFLLFFFTYNLFAQKIIVGAYNDEPLIYQNQNNEIVGFYVDILNYIAEKEGWDLEYVYDTQKNQLDKLEQKKIDIFTAFADTKERRKKYLFNNEIFLSNWGQVVVADNIKVTSILDLKKKKISVMKGDVYYVGTSAIKELNEKFNLEIKFVEVDDYSQIMLNIEHKITDAGVLPRFWLELNKKKYSDYISTSIIFKPISLKICSLKGHNEEIIFTVDKYLKLLKEDHDSIYHKSLDKWFVFSSSDKVRLPEWLKLIFIQGIIIFFFLWGIILILRRKIKKQNYKLKFSNYDLKRELNARKKAEENLRVTLTSIGEGVIVTDSQGKINLVNEKAEFMINKKNEEILNLTFSDIFQRRIIEEEGIDPVNFVLKEKKNITCEKQFFLKTNEKEIIVNISASPIFSIENEFFGIVIVFSDITEKFYSEKRNYEINRQLMEANKELKSLDILKNNLLSNVSHELRTPLVAIRGYSEMLYRMKIGELNEKQLSYLKIILNSVDKLTYLIDLLLDFSRMETGKIKLEKSIFYLHEVIDDVVKLIKVKSDLKQIAVEYNELKDKIFINGDRNKISQVFLNLLDNAVKFSKTGVTIKVILKNLGDKVEIKIVDQGIGIPKEKLSKIFGRFYQVDSSTTRKYGGMGIGLALCESFVKLHKGTISVESQIGVGTTFKVILPLYLS